MKEFKLSRALLSSYYIAAIFSFFIFQLFNEAIFSASSWLISFVKVFFNVGLNNTTAWVSLFAICFLITFIIRRFVVAPLGFYIKDEGAPMWELVVLGVLVLGFYVYLLNQAFEQPMPDTWPRVILKMVDGYKNTFPASLASTSVEERNTYVIVPFLWNLGPIAFMFARTQLKNLGKPAGAE